MKRSKYVLFGLFLTLCMVGVSHAATLIVTKTADTNDGICNADCSLREAVAAANLSAEADRIRFDTTAFASPQTITLTLGELVLSQPQAPILIDGPGANRLTISGNNASRIITIGRNVFAVIRGFTFTGGNSVGAADSGRAGAIYNVGGTTTISDSIITGNTSTGGGGAFNNAGSSSPAPTVPGSLTILYSVVSNNTAAGSGGSIQNFSGSTLSIENSTFTGNTSTNSTGGGAMALNGIARITNTTVSGNSAPAGSGGGIQSNGTSLTLTNVTVSGNSSLSNGGGIHRATTNISIFLRNTIVAGNTGTAASPDATASATISSLGNNMIGVTGTSTGWIASDLLNTDPKLAPLGFYGGFGMTHALLDGSPAINAGNNCVLDVCETGGTAAPIRTDQREVVRRASPGVDIGSFEVDNSYRATLASAAANTAYAYTLVPAASTFTYSVASGNFGGILLSSAASVNLAGTSVQPGAYNASVQITGPAGSAVVNYQLNVLANPNIVSVSGRVVADNGVAVGNVPVNLIDSQGNARLGRTSSFGYFRFDGVAAGQVYGVEVRSKRYPFGLPRPILVSDVVAGLEIFPLVPLLVPFPASR